MTAPRLARLLIRLSAPADRRDDLLGDLEEGHRRRRAGGAPSAWFCTCLEAAAIAGAIISSRVRDAAGAGSGRLFDRTSVRLAIRLMFRQPVLTLTATASLALGIGLATVGFAFMDTALFSRLPFEGGDRFVVLRVFEEPQHTPARLTPASYRTLAKAASSLEYVGGLTGARENVTLPSGDTQIVTTAGVTPTTLRFLPWAPLAGRLLVPGDGAAGAAPVAMIRESFRRRALAGGSVIGASIELAGVRRVIVGVVSDEFTFPNAPDVWVPLSGAFLDGRARPDADIRLFGILANGRSIDDARAELDAIAPALAADSTPASPVRLDVTTFTDLGPMGRVLAALVVGLVLVVLVVIAANVGNLILARSFARAREFALRSALGASRRRLVAQVFVEVLLLAGAASLAGAGAAVAVLRQFNTMDERPYWADFTPGPRTVLLVIGVTLSAAVVAGVWPALRATRRTLGEYLQSGGGRESDVRFGRAAGAMVVLQIAVSIAMLNGAAIFAQAFSTYSAPLNLPSNVLTTSLSLNPTRRPADGARAALTAGDIEQTVLSVPGIVAAGLGTAVPRFSPPAEPVEVDGPSDAPAARQPASSVEVTGGYLAALDAHPIAGRLLVPTDYLPGAPPVAVVNEPFARRFFGGASPVGRRLRTAAAAGAGPWREIVGVVADLGMNVVDPSMAAGYYVPLNHDTSFVYVVMRTNGDPLLVDTPVRRALLERDPGLVPNRMQRLEDVGSDDVTAFEWLSAAMVGIGAVTLVLALVGIYAMMALVVTRRTREIGIRVALGASASHIIRAILGRAAWQVGVGGALGIVLALLSRGARGIFVARLGDGGPWTLPAVAALLIAAALVATWLPLRRALGVRPTDALRID